MKVLIDPGHGGSDPGACANGLREADIALNVSRLLVTLLRQKGVEVRLTRDGDNALGPTKGHDLEARCQIERTWGPDLFVSIHCNAAMADTARGFEVWTSVGQTRSDRAAEHIVNAFHTAFPYRLLRRDLSDGDQDKESNFYVLRCTDGPAVLVELGFLTHAEEAAWVRDNQVPTAQALSRGILAALQGAA